MKKLSTYYEDLVLDPKANCFCMLKPGFVKYKDEFEKLLRAYGWKICKTCTKLFTRPEIEEFYICHKDKGFYNKLCDYMITEACQCYAVYKHIKNPVKDMESFKEKIRQEWGEDEMRNGMHSSDSDDNVKREIELAFNCVNERLVLSKNTLNQEITWDSFIEALLKHNDGTLELEENNIEIVVSPPDKFTKYTMLGRLKGRQITEIRVYGNRNDGYRISIDINDDFQSGMTIFDMEDLRDVFGEEQIEQIYFMVS